MQPTREDLADNGRLYLKKIKDGFEAAISELQFNPNTFDPDLTLNNSYLPIQGHHLYKLVKHIGSLICKGTGIKFTSEVLNTFNQFSGYDEIDHVQSDLKTILLSH